MGEIKSTLDLVMERTKHLSMTNEEKIQQHRADFEKKLNGLLARYADRAIPRDVLQDQISKLQTEIGIEDVTLVKKAIIDRMDLDQENTLWMNLMDTINPDACKPLKTIFEEYHRQKADLSNNNQKDILDRLAKHHGISGSAVLPNPEKDPQCKAQLIALKDKALKQIQTV